jgi:hypothetical protein
VSPASVRERTLIGDIIEWVFATKLDYSLGESKVKETLMEKMHALWFFP